LAELHLTLPQAMLLRQLGDALPMNEAADKLHCDPSNVTGIVDRLEARGLIERQHLTTDRRVKHLALTPAGRRLLSRVEAVLAAPASRSARSALPSAAAIPASMSSDQADRRSRRESPISIASRMDSRAVDMSPWAIVTAARKTRLMADSSRRPFALLTSMLC